ncbi:hypothetical protein [Leptospira ryugenii]|nr:hypothetical protein [Leptospira ryugenii]
MIEKKEEHFLVLMDCALAHSGEIVKYRTIPFLMFGKDDDREKIS